MTCVSAPMKKLFSLDWPNPTDGEHRIVSRVTDAISMTERRAMEAERDTIDRYSAE